ncbi:MAG: DUF86 domain-containing protein, partial [Gorillibacterium sp.]|nr:DUF86 domain-containing protein [Gorillibacterium sp.]
MYSNNQDELNRRLSFLPVLAEVSTELNLKWVNGDFIQNFAQERILHLAIEAVTDIGSLLIDAFVLRDAGSYEDIIEILVDEQVVAGRLASFLHRLVKLRKALVQEYTEWSRLSLHPLIPELPSMLSDFADQVKIFIAKEKAIFTSESQ